MFGCAPPASISSTTLFLYTLAKWLIFDRLEKLSPIYSKLPLARSSHSEVPSPAHVSYFIGISFANRGVFTTPFPLRPL